MKKLLFLTISIMTVLLSGCKTPTEDLSFSYDDTVVYTLTFRQDGQADIIREVEENQPLTDIPMPVNKKGYSVRWEQDDFSCVNQDVLILAVETANEYTVSFDLYSVWGQVDYDGHPKMVTYDSAYDLGEPSLYGFFFTGWEIKDDGTEFASNGVYTVDKDITLVPTWEKDEESYRWWGGLI